MITLDPGLASLLTVVVTTLGAIALAYIGYKQAQLQKIMTQVRTNTDGMTTALVAMTEKANLAEGNLAGRIEQTAEQKVLAADAALKK